MARKKKVRFTGFARFLLVMVFIVPAAYFGAHYINNEDGINRLKHFLGIDLGEEVQDAEVPPADIEEVAEVVEEAVPEDTIVKEEVVEKENTAETDTEEVKAMQAELEYQKRRMDELKLENERLRQQIWEKDQEIGRLRKE